MAASAQLEQRVEVLEDEMETISVTSQEAYNKADASMGRQDMLAGNLIEVRKATRRIENLQEAAKNWQGLTDLKLDILGRRQEEMETRLVSMSERLDDIDGKYDTLDKKYDTLDKKVEGLDKKVGLIAEDVGGLKAGQIELKDMVATLLARSEEVEKQK